MDSLIELPFDEWGKLRDMFGSHWPENAVPFCILDMNVKHPGLDKDFSFKVYCPEGNMSNGMIAISRRNNYYQLVIHPMGSNNNTSMQKIKEALLHTKLIDWNCYICVPSANDDALECLEAVKNDLGVDIHFTDNSKAYKHILTVKDSNGQETNRRHDIILPPNTYIGPLKTENIDLVDKTWTFHGDTTYSYFETLQKHNLVHVLYSKVDDKPMAWIGVENFGALLHLFCLPEHRRKGYAEVITKHIINTLLNKGLNVLAYTLEDNVNPKKLFSKLGFKDIGSDNWVFISKKKSRK